jgi:hypothetical protein
MGANAQTSVPTFTAGEVLTAANMNISARTGIPVFADATARNAAFGGTGEKTLAEGQFAYLEDSNTTQYYDGAAWQSVGVTPGLKQIVASSVAVTGGSATGSVDANGNITFALATGISLNGIFSATYDYYTMRFSLTACSGSDDNMEFRFRVGGSDDANSSYRLQRLEISATTITAQAATTQAQYFIGGGNSSTDGDQIFGLLDFLDPFGTKVSKVTTTFYAVNNSGTQKSTRTTGVFDNTTSFDGISFRLAGLTGPTMSGNISVYGYSK